MTMKLLDIEPYELAQQLTIIESKLFVKFRPTDGNPWHYDDNAVAIMDTSNKVCSAYIQFSW